MEKYNIALFPKVIGGKKIGAYEGALVPCVGDLVFKGSTTYKVEERWINPATRNVNLYVTPLKVFNDQNIR